MALVRGCLSPDTAKAWSGDAACAVSEDIEYAALHLDYWLSLV
jgi:hypothetical protein